MNVKEQLRTKISDQRQRLFSLAKTRNSDYAKRLYKKYMNAQDIQFDTLNAIPAGSQVELPSLVGGKIIVQKHETDDQDVITYTNRWSEGATLIKHYHSDCTEHVQLIEGTLLCIDDDGEESLGPGDHISFAPSEAHAFTALTSAVFVVSFKRVR